MDALLTILIPLLIQVESSGNPNAFKADENAAGLFQIRPIYLTDVNRISGKNYTMEERYDPQKSEQMVRIYLTHYGNVYKQKTGKEPTLEVLARMHNGGFRGWDKRYKEKYRETTKYWKKVKGLYEQQAEKD